MQVILSHINLDFDGLASMLAAKKLYPKAKLVLPSKQGKAVERFLAIYRDSLNLFSQLEINWELVNKVIIVDTASLQRVGDIAKHIKKENVEFIVYDHHEENEFNVKASKKKIETVGATVTLILEEIKEKNITISPFEATIFALGLYTDTGSFTYLSTTPRDLTIASFLIESGANLQLVSNFSTTPLQEEEQHLLECLLQQIDEYYIDGVDLLIAYHQQKHYTGGLSFLARKALEMSGTDALIFVVEMGNRIFIVGRSTSDRIDILPLIKQLGGGGHQKAASAMVKHRDFQEVLTFVRKNIVHTVEPAITAKDIMSTPVKVVSVKTTIEEAGKMMLRYGHTGFPVIENGQLVGIISRRDIDKARHHGLGHAPVKGYMSTNPTTINQSYTLEEIQHIMIEKNIGRLPVVENNKIVGILSRTNIIEALHGDCKNHIQFRNINRKEFCLVEQMKEFLAEDILKLVKTIGEFADTMNYPVYIIGGIVRDLIIGRKNEDIDIVVEGNGINFANCLAEQFGGTVRCHEQFGTATWKHPSHLKIDISSARTEFYDFPAALPTVEMSSLREDLYRRDFTINAMAIQINAETFGKLIDYFHGYEDIKNAQIKTLYNLSFVEDPTRILRAVRFEQRFNFKMDKQTFKLALISADKIISTSKPRLAHELNILLNEERPIESLLRLKQLGIIYYLTGQDSFNEQSLNKFKTLTDEVTTHMLINRQSLQLWICYLVILFSEKENRFEHVSSFALNQKTLKVIEGINALLNDDLSFCTEKQLGNYHRFLKNYPLESILCYTVLSECENEQFIKTYLINREKIEKFIDGNDLKSLGIKPGPIYSEILLQIECAQLNNDISNKEEALQFVIRKFLN